VACAELYDPRRNFLYLVKSFEHSCGFHFRVLLHPIERILLETALELPGSTWPFSSSQVCVVLCCVVSLSFSFYQGYPGIQGKCLIVSKARFLSQTLVSQVCLVSLHLFEKTPPPN